VIGYDDIEVAEYLGLTTMRREMFASGQQGVELLHHVLTEPAVAPTYKTLPAKLTVRRPTASTGS
jgi:LacI family transcriptional regulator